MTVRCEGETKVGTHLCMGCNHRASLSNTEPPAVAIYKPQHRWVLIFFKPTHNTAKHGRVRGRSSDEEHRERGGRRVRREFTRQMRPVCHVQQHHRVFFSLLLFSEERCHQPTSQDVTRGPPG